jgi:acyl-CoA thioesterase-2
MGDLQVDTAVERVGDGHYRAMVSREWEIWGPMGGYMAALALRAAGAEASFQRPASFSCHYLSVAAFEPVDLHVTRLRGGRNAESLRVSVTQGDRAVLEATVWAVNEIEGLEHDVTEVPPAPHPDTLPGMAELAVGEEAPFPFWNNFDMRPLSWRKDWPPPVPLEPRWRNWLRFLPTSTFKDPWVDAARALIVVDVQCWPSVPPHHAWKWPDGPEWMAPSLDLYVAFHNPRPDEPWLLADGYAPVAGDGLVGWTGRMWTPDGVLVASGGGQLLCRRVPKMPW